MASVKTSYSGKWHTFGNQTVEDALKMYHKDMKEAKENKYIQKITEKEESNGCKEFEAIFFDGWNEWSLFEIFDPNDNKIYTRF